MKYPNGPKTNWDLQGEAILRGKIPTTEQDIPMLLEWLKDMNWPGARHAAAHVRSFGAVTLEPVRAVLKSEDHIWILWVLQELGPAFPKNYWQSLIPELESVARIPDEEGAHIEALTILAIHSLEPAQTIRNLLITSRRDSGLPSEDYNKVVELLDSKGSNP